MSSFRYFLVFAVSLVALKSPAQSVPSSACAGQAIAPLREVIFYKTSEDCTLFRRLNRVLTNLTERLTPGPTVSLILRDKATNASFDNGHIIWLPKALYARSGPDQEHVATPSQLATVLVHEYGHALLKVRLEQEFHQDFNGLFWELADISAESLENIRLGISSRGIQARGNHLAGTEEFQIFFKHYPAYSELYADLVAILYFDDPSAMSSAMNFAAHGRFQSSVTLRDFGRENTMEEIITSNDPHTALSLARSHLGKWVRTKRSWEEKKQLLKTVEDIIVENLRKDLQEEEIRSIQEINAAITKALP